MENENAVALEKQETTPPAKKKYFGAKCKEWFRKQCVSLKRSPQKIAGLFFVVSSVMFLLALGTLSPGPVKDFTGQPHLGLSLFINTLFSILILVLFMNTFPKRGIRYKKQNGKKHSMNYIMLALVFVFLAAMIFFDVLYYKQLLGCIAQNESTFFDSLAVAEKYKAYWSESFAANPVLDAGSYKSYLVASFNFLIAHIVMLGISGVLLATLPLYKKLIMKINTKQVIEGSTLSADAIDTEADV